MNKEKIIITCEHATNFIPEKYAFLQIPKKVLESHEGYDIGALSYAKTLCSTLDTKCFYTNFSRLLLDPNRSLHNPCCFSRYSKMLSPSEKEACIAEFYIPFRKQVKQAVQRAISSRGAVIHLSCHSFTPELHRQKREYDVGLLYDPKSAFEVAFAQALRIRLMQKKSMSVALNRPYKGLSDGHTTALRKEYAKNGYIGIEIEVNQKFFTPVFSKQWHEEILPYLCEEIRFVCNHFR